MLPAGATRVRLRSRVNVPSDINPAGGDTRRLGVPLLRLLYDGESLALDGEQFGEGFLLPEPEWRWTTGDGELILAPRDFEATLELHLGLGWNRYWVTKP
jgi:hypothetical protein